MISLNVKDNQIAVTVMGQFTLDDYREFEQAVCYGIQFQGTVNLLFDLRDMLSYSVDVAWEELKFSREHKNDFGRIAILTGDQWVAWSMWVNRLFMSADIRLFDELELAQAWVAGGELPATRCLARAAGKSPGWRNSAACALAASHPGMPCTGKRRELAWRVDRVECT